MSSVMEETLRDGAVNRLCETSVQIDGLASLPLRPRRLKEYVPQRHREHRGFLGMPQRHREHRGQSWNTPQRHREHRGQFLEHATESRRATEVSTTRT